MLALCFCSRPLTLVKHVLAQAPGVSFFAFLWRLCYFWHYSGWHDVTRSLYGVSSYLGRWGYEKKTGFCKVELRETTPLSHAHQTSHSKAPRHLLFNLKTSLLPSHTISFLVFSLLHQGSRGRVGGGVAGSDQGEPADEGGSFGLVAHCRPPRRETRLRKPWDAEKARI